MRVVKRALLGGVLGAAVVAGLLAAVPASADGLDTFRDQELTWQTCDDPRLDPVGAQCADVTVPVDYSAPDGETMTVAISRLPATDPARRRGVLLSNPGGPGGPGLDFVVDIRNAMTPEVAAGYDLIGLDPRGIGRSTPVNCRWREGFWIESAGFGDADFAASTVRQGELAAQCAATEGARLRHITTRNTARDMDLIRSVLGEDRISYFGTSYGTYLGAVYTQLFGDHADRFVLDSAVDPARYGATEMLRDMGPANEAAFDLWADWAAAHAGEYRFGADRSAVREFVQTMVRRAKDQPIRIGDFTVDQHDLPNILFAGLDDPRKYPALAGQLRQLADAADGATVTPDPELAATLAFMLRAEPRDLSTATAVLCGDAASPSDPAWYRRNIEASRADQPLFGAFTNNITPCAFWALPAEPKTVVDNAVPSLIVQSTGDTRTTYPGALGMHRALRESRMVTLPDVPIHWIYGNYPNSCVSTAVNTYLLDGTLPATDLTCRDEAGPASGATR
ncbi:alpha/beta hydrolase [Nocardia asteroides]|uniref:Tripeptidylaminopeptidase n=1 Tax=Nocardia asteroides NBRC 15531 TaxID=1110697 RepID=U5EHT1_NOCAS|nr:alpha/beta hydrolase [Nocardia asteroides]UGT48204.1 alpha/beta hydrolase [Nocardia asteroides]GAD84689.1 putative tripeptidylaminopeptidase [Nocardia asteroides NBRC 15531]